MRRIALTLLTLLVLSSGGLAETAVTRVALVIGVDNYAHLSRLNNPVRDATAVARLFETYGFQVVSVSDPDHETFGETLETFARLAEGAEEAVVYYAGHGMTALKNNRLANVLAPVDAAINCETRTAERVVTMQDIAQAIEGVPRTVLIFDACRSDPIRNCEANALTRSLYGFQPARMDSAAAEEAEAEGSAVERGLRRIRADTANQSASTIVAYSTDLGFTASDGPAGQHSPYAKALLEELARGPELPIYKVLVNTSARVHESARQRSWIVTKGAEPDMCLRGHDCESSDELKRKKALERSRVLIKTSEAKVAEGSTREALEAALEAYRLTEGARLSVDAAETQLYNALWRHREVRRRKLDITTDRPMAWFDRRSGNINVRVGENEVAVLDHQLKLLSTRTARAAERRFFGRTEENADAIAYEGKRQRIARAGRLKWSADRRWVTMRFPGRNAFTRTIKASDVPFAPTQVFLGTGDDPEHFRVILRNRSRTEPKIAVIRFGVTTMIRTDGQGNRVVEKDPSQTVSTIGNDRRHYIHSSGDVIVFSSGWASSYVVNTNFPSSQIKLNDYLKNTTGYIGDVVYFPKEELFGYIGTSRPGAVRQPILLSSRSGVRAAVLGGHAETVNSFDSNLDAGVMLSLADDHVLRLWNLYPRSEAKIADRYEGIVLQAWNASLEETYFSQYSDPTSHKTWERFIDPVTLRLRYNQKRKYAVWTSPVSALALVHSESELLVFRRDQPDRLLFRKKLSRPLAFASQDRDSGRIVAADQGGTVRIWSPNGGELFTGMLDPGQKVLAVEFDPLDAQLLLVGTSKEVSRWDLRSADRKVIFQVPAGEKAVKMYLDDSFVRYAAGEPTEQYDTAKEGVLVDLESRQEQVRLRCYRPLQVDTTADVVFCPNSINGVLPYMVRLTSRKRLASVFPDTNTDATSGLKHHASMQVDRIKTCKRVFINLGGGIGDDMYRGEGLLYDLEEEREIARDKGDPGADYEGYRGGKDLPVFCTAADLANYVDDLLRTSIVK